MTILSSPLPSILLLTLHPSSMFQVTVKGVENDLTINTLGAKRGDGGGGEEAMTPSGEEKEIEEDLTSDIDFRVVQRRCQVGR